MENCIETGIDKGISGMTMDNDDGMTHEMITMIKQLTIMGWWLLLCVSRDDNGMIIVGYLRQ